MLSRAAAPGRSRLSQRLPYCFGAPRAVPERAVAGACWHSAVCHEGPAHPPRHRQPSSAATAPQARQAGQWRCFVWPVSLPVALGGLKSLFLNHVCVGQARLGICLVREDPGGEPWGRAQACGAGRGGCAAAATRSPSVATGCAVLARGRPTLPWLLQPAGRQQQGFGPEEPRVRSCVGGRCSIFLLRSDGLELVCRWLWEGFDSDILKL